MNGAILFLKLTNIHQQKEFVMKILNLVSLLCFLAGNIFSQQQVTIYESGKESIVRYINEGGQYDYTYNVTHNIGREDGHNGNYAGSQEDIWRSEHTFSLSAIPSNADITQASLLFLVGSYQCSSCSLKITQTTGQYVYGQQWSAINNANTIVSSFVYSSGSNTISSTALKNAIISALSSGTLYLGSLSLVEGANLSYASLELRLIVDYTVTPQNVDITVDNNFTAFGGLNHGTMVVAGTNRTIPLTGYTFSKTVGSNLTLQAVSPQNDNQGYQELWSTAPSYHSDWKRNLVFRSQNNPYTFTVSSDDNGKTYMAYYKQLKATTSGTLSSNETWFTNVTLIGTVTVPPGVTLTITSNATVNLGELSIVSTGGTITKEAGATINGLRAYIKNGSTIKGICGLIQTACVMLKLERDFC